MKLNLNNRIQKIVLIFYCLFSCYIFVYYASNELYFERYPSVFLAFIQMNLKDYISLNYIPFMSLFTSSIHIPSGFPIKIQHIILAESYFPNTSYLFLMLQRVLNISPEVLLALPLGVIFIPISYLVLIRSCIPSNGDQYRRIFQYLLFIFVLVYIGSQNYYGSFYVAPPSFTLIILSVFLLKKSFETKARSPIIFSLLICVFSLVNYWHTGFMLYFFFIVSISLVYYFIYLMTKLFPNLFLSNNFSVLFAKSRYLIVIISIIFLAFIHLWQDSYLQFFVSDATLSDFIKRAILKLQGQVAFPIPYVFNYKDLFYGGFYFKSLILVYIISSVIFLIPIILFIINSLHTKKVFIKIPFLFAISILLAQILLIFAYYKTGSISFTYIPLFFPLFGIYLFLDLNSNNFVKNNFFWRNIIIVFLILIILLSLSNIVFFSLTNEVGMTSVTKYADTEDSFEWLYHKMNIDNPVIVDFNIIGKYIKRESMISRPRIKYVDLDTNIYSILVGDNTNLSVNLYNNYIIIDEATMQRGLPIQVNSGRGALVPLPVSIDNCHSQNKIYSDHFISVYRF